MDESLMLQVLTRLLTQLPLALVYVVGLALLFTRRPGRARTLGICGLAVLLLALGLGLALWFVPMWLISQGHSYSSISSLLGIVNGAVALIFAVGMLLLVLALRFAMPPRVANPR
ncbi:hypothetical protein NB717_002068 [Xanthomonas sacchari]|uniref:hypothetical protein n=2 Tax=Xanthomonas sacchari TaxID=56458 RepID=UPI002256E82E|nr:hypothetical protein [Xanthomonas sacchari]MCW0404428.1 hypothetical protein [Xanthomonas sacchari]MCW0417304.1 hypothetical protein [Xanthomonas sacchari]MCW0461000.1 hypothetical protein [Xanthomonas sacchari]